VQAREHGGSVLLDLGRADAVDLRQRIQAVGNSAHDVGELAVGEQDVRRDPLIAASATYSFLNHDRHTCRGFHPRTP